MAKVKAPALIDTSLYTEDELRQLPIKWVEQYLGSKTGSTGHHAIVDMFNAASSSVRDHRMYYGSPWCACTASAAFIGSGLAGSKGSGALCCFAHAACQGMIKKAKALKIWHENEHAYTPQPGDVILFAWGGGRNGANYDTKAISHHSGIVRYSDDKYVYTIEGNRGKRVGYHKYSLVSGDIRGYIAPKYAEFAGKPLSKMPQEVSANIDEPVELEKVKEDVITYTYLEPVYSAKTNAKNVIVRDQYGNPVTGGKLTKKGTKVTVTKKQATRIILDIGDKKGKKPYIFSEVTYKNTKTKKKTKGYIYIGNLTISSKPTKYSEITSDSDEVLDEE